MTDFCPHVLEVDGSFNVRDMGGYTTTTGVTIQQGVLVRSGNLDKVTPAGQKTLLDYGICTVLDIRAEWETEHYPNVFRDVAQVTYRNLPLITDAQSNDPAFKTGERACETRAEKYLFYLEQCKPQVNAIMMAIAESDTGVIFHCHAGKDRTGIIAALLHSLAGVPDADIAADYALTQQYIGHLIAEWRLYAMERGDDMVAFEKRNATEPQTILTMLADLREKYSTTGGYLRDCGIDDAILHDIKQKMFIDKN